MIKDCNHFLYQREYQYIFSKKAPCVRGATVVSAFVEGQIFLLAKYFLDRHGVKYKPSDQEKYRQSLNILEANNILNKKELNDLKAFWNERNKSIHGPFKGMDEEEWKEQNKRVVLFGRPIVKILNKKLVSGGILKNKNDI